MPSFFTDAKPECWRAVAIFEDGRNVLLYLGMSSQKIREGYAAAYFDILEEDERLQVNTISLQRWNGPADSARWSQTTTLPLPLAPNQLVRDEADIPLASNRAFANAYQQAKQTGLPLVQTIGHDLYEVQPDGSKRFIKALEQPLTVIPGTKVKIA